MIQLLSDENFHGDIVRGLLLRSPQLNLVRVQDDGLQATDDPDILEWAATHRYIVLTHDRATMPDFAFSRIAEGEPMAGMLVVNDRIAVGDAINEIQIVVECADESELVDRVIYLPL